MGYTIFWCVWKDNVKKNKAKVVKEETVEDIKVWWSKASFWDDLSYEDKLRYYWEFKYDDKGNRVFVVKSDD